MPHPDRPPFRPGDHVCTFYRGHVEHIFATVEFLREGLARDERCVYVTCDEDPATFGTYLRYGGIDVDAEQQRGALTILSNQEAHLREGAFSADGMIALLHEAAADARRQGFAALRVGGDMAWLLAEPAGHEEFVDCERRLTAFCASTGAIVLCQYDHQRLAPSALEAGIATHPLVWTSEDVKINPFYERTQPALARTPASASSVYERLKPLRLFQ